MTETILKVKNLTVKFGKEVVVSNVSFSVERGEVLTIIGPNGSGKTTLLRALLGIIPYEGKVWWKPGIKVNFLPQHLSKLTFSKIPMTVSEFFKLKTIEEREVKSMLKRVGLNTKVLNKNPSELSMGQFQRVLIAWSLIDKPDVLLMDEPMTGIDVGGLKTVYSLLESFWKKEGLTILMVTHDLNVVYSLSTRCLCMCKDMACYGPPKEILTPETLKKLYGGSIKFFKHTHWW